MIPHVMAIYREQGTDAFRYRTPFQDFVNKYKELRAKGYSEYKAFAKVEEELAEILDA